MLCYVEMKKILSQQSVENADVYLNWNLFAPHSKK